MSQEPGGGRCSAFVSHHPGGGVGGSSPIKSRENGSNPLTDELRDLQEGRLARAADVEGSRLAAGTKCTGRNLGEKRSVIRYVEHT